MSHPRVFFCLLAVLATQTAMAAAPTTLDLSGVVRDFKRSHPDFDVMPIGGPGHYASNVALTLGPSSNPVFGGGGFKVTQQWQNPGSHPIAPHMSTPAGSPPRPVLPANAPPAPPTPTPAATGPPGPRLSPFALRYIPRRRSCGRTGGVIMPPLPHLLPKES